MYLESMVIMLTMQYAISQPTAGGFSNLGAEFRAFFEQESLALPDSAREGPKSPAVAEALSRGDTKTALALLKDIIEQNRENVGVLPVYAVMQKLFSDTGDLDSAERWGRLEIESIEKAVKKHSKSEGSILLLELYGKAWARLPGKTLADYQRARTFLEEQCRAIDHTEYQDVALIEFCKVDYWFESYEDVLASCDRVDRWYEGRETEERGRTMPDLWRARALFKLGKKDEAASVLERLLASKNPAVILKNSAIAAELRSMQEDPNFASPPPREVCDSEAWKPLVADNVQGFRLYLGRLQYQITRPEGIAAFKLALSQEWWTDPDPKWSSGRQIWGGQLISDTSNGPRKLDVIVAQRGKTTYECLPIRIGTCSVKADSLLARLISAIVEKRLPESKDQKVVADTEIAGGFTSEELDRIDSDELRELVKGGLPGSKQTSPPATQKLSAPPPQAKVQPTNSNNLIAKGCGGQHSAGCATGTGSGCGAAKVAKSQGCGCGSGGCGGPAAGPLGGPSTPKPIVDQAPVKRGEKDSLLVTSAGASCCSTTAAKPAAASKAKVGCGQGCGCGCGAAPAPGPESKASTRHQAPVPAAK